MPNRSKTMHTMEQVVSAIKKRKGKLYLVAGDLKVTTQTLRNYAKRWPEVEVAIREAKGRMLDVAESKLYAAIEKGQAWAICFYLKTQGKKRGYVERLKEKPKGEGPAPDQDSQTIQELLDEVPLEIQERMLEKLGAKKQARQAAGM